MAERSGEHLGRLSELLDAALELVEPERGRWLADLATQDPDMAAAVSRMLEDSTSPGFAEFLAQPWALADEEAPVPSLIGRQVGPYLIEAEIGRGGMGSVWRARRADGRFEGVVAIKFVHAAWVGQQGEQRFRSEGRLLGRLNHPNIARLLDAGIIDGQPYLVLEYIAGEPIDEYCERERPDLPARLRLFLDVLSAIAHAHSHLVVHRDIKPSNIFVTGDGEVKLLDFGIAKLLDDDTQSPAATQMSAVPLTPQYASPEQLLGQPVTTATDVYAAGLVLYLLLAGSHPVRADAATSAALIQSILTQDFPRPSVVGTLVTVRAATLAGDLDNIVARAVKKEPRERYSSANEFADDLRRYLAHEPVQARPDTLAYRLGKFVRRHRGGVAAGVMVAVSLVAGAVGTVIQARRAERSAVQALQAKQRAIQQLTYAESTNEFLTFLLEDESSKPFTTRELLSQGESLVDRQFADDPGLRAKLLLSLASMYEEMEESKKAESLLYSAQGAALTASDPSLKVEVDCALAFGLGGGGAYQQSLALLDPAIRSTQSDPAVEPGIRALCLANRGAVHVELKEADAALRDAQAALEVLGTPRAGQRGLALFARQTLADARDMQGDYAAAVQEYQRILEELDRMGRGQTSYAMTTLNGYGVKLARSGQWLRAAEAYQRCLAATGPAEGAEVRPSLESNYAKLLVDLGRPQEARPLFEAALESATRRNDPRSIMYATLLSAPAWCETGELTECEARLKRAEDLAHQLLPAGHTAFGVLEFEKGQLAALRRQYPVARAHLQAAIEFVNASSDKSPTEIRARLHLARTDLQLGDLGAATAEAEDAVQRARAALHGFKSSAWLGAALLIQGQVEAARGNKGAARELLQQARAQLGETEGDEAPATQEARGALSKL